MKWSNLDYADVNLNIACMQLIARLGLLFLSVSYNLYGSQMKKEKGKKKEKKKKEEKKEKGMRKSWATLGIQTQDL